MLTPFARSSVSAMLDWGCWIGIYPYSWDAARFRLGDAARAQTRVYHFRRHLVALMLGFNVFRVIHTASAGDLPPRLRVMNVSYIFGWILVNLCFVQFQTKREILKAAINALLEEVDRQRQWGQSETVAEKDKDGSKNESNPKPMTKKDAGFNWVSWLIITSTILLFLNPVTHALPILDVPCAPQYLGSVLFGCKNSMDDPFPWLLKLVLFAFEVWVMSDMMFTLSFNSNLCFMAMTWVQQELRGVEFKDIGADVGQVETQYRKLQLLLALFNDAFRLYLTAFPSLLFTIAGIFLFGTIRYSYLPLFAYWVFPSCTFRCLFEATAALTAAGFVNSESKLYLTKWDRTVDKIQGGYDGEEKVKKLARTFRKSCSTLKCMAGSLYSFENSIVLVSLSNTLMLTMNMFITFKNAENL